MNLRKLEAEAEDEQMISISIMEGQHHQQPPSSKEVSSIGNNSKGTAMTGKSSAELYECSEDGDGEL